MCVTELLARGMGRFGELSFWNSYHAVFVFELNSFFSPSSIMPLYHHCLPRSIAPLISIVVHLLLPLPAVGVPPFVHPYQASTSSLQAISLPLQTSIPELLRYPSSLPPHCHFPHPFPHPVTSSSAFPSESCPPSPPPIQPSLTQPQTR